jgi:hypothetical protein
MEHIIENPWDIWKDMKGDKESESTRDTSFNGVAGRTGRWTRSQGALTYGAFISGGKGG